MKQQWLAVALGLSLVLACSRQDTQKPNVTFQDDVAFLHKYTSVILLSSADSSAQVAVTPDLQGRVMTSTATGASGRSYGWINRELIASGIPNRHINAFGGEDRFWLGPEGGQYSLYFAKGDPFDLQHWYTPRPFNEEGFIVLRQNPSSVAFSKRMSIRNYADFVFTLELQRTVRLLSRAELEERVRIELPAGLAVVGFESENTITNIGERAWEKETGLVSIWILGMFTPSPTTVIAVPYVAGPEAALGPVVVSDYFGAVPPDRLQIKDHAVFFKGDGLYRSKIGMPRNRVKPVLGSYDSALGVLTLVLFTLPEEARDYVNSQWRITDHPYAGDVANSYNDGPASPGAKPMGPFYELESSSPAAALAPNESCTHRHTTLHFCGDRTQLDQISLAVLGVSLNDFKTAFN
ncbi:MAG: hypothetical protein BWY83_02814 [bacterium ADurb.Bin478]|nr:MAG: hypothetical protein BWY83_02814 [bacterium ADurb.Bin478]